MVRKTIRVQLTSLATQTKIWTTLATIMTTTYKGDEPVVEEEEVEKGNSANPDDSACLDDEDGGFVNPRRLGLYVTQ